MQNPRNDQQTRMLITSTVTQICWYAEYVMYVEGVNDSGQHNIAVMRSTDQGQTWRVCNDGKPVIQGQGTGSTGTACVVRPTGPDSEDWWVYCVTASKAGGFSIGLAMSSTGPEGPFEWYEG